MFNSAHSLTNDELLNTHSLFLLMFTNDP